MKLYYNVVNMGMGPALLVTEQGYYDRTRHLDDGNGPDHDAMDAALVKAGADPLAESVYGPGNTGFQGILKNLRADGHLLAAKPGMGACSNEN